MPGTLVRLWRTGIDGLGPQHRPGSGGVDDTGEGCGSGSTSGGWAGTGRRGPGRRAGRLDAARWAETAGFDVVTTADHFGGHLALRDAGRRSRRHGAGPAADLRARRRLLEPGPARARRRDARRALRRPGRGGAGAGHKPAEHEAVGLPFPPFRERVAAWRHVRRRAAPAPRGPAVQASPGAAARPPARRSDVGGRASRSRPRSATSSLSPAACS